MNKLKDRFSSVKVPVIGVLLSMLFSLGAFAQGTSSDDSTSALTTMRVKFDFEYKSDSERISHKGKHELISGQELSFDLGENELKLIYEGKELKFKIQSQSDQKVLLGFSSPFSGFLQRSMGIDQSEIRRFFVKIKEIPIKK